MPDTTEKTIYKLELDDSGYIAGVERLSASTSKLTTAQEQSNKRLAENEEILKKQAELVKKNQKALEDYTGSDNKARKELENNLKSAQTGYAKLNEMVVSVRKGYEAANKAAQDFSNTSKKATQLQQATTGGKIPVSVPIIQSVIPQLAEATQDFDLKEAIAFGKTAEEFNKLKTALGGAGQQLSGFDEIVKKGKVAMDEYEKITKKTDTSTLSLRTQIRLGREELVRLEQAGKSGTKQYFELEKNVARLTDAFGDQQARIKILASDTRALDFGKSAIQSATSSFQIYAAVSILVGGENEKLQKQTLQLFAAMQLLTALEQLSITVKRGGVIATNAQAVSQAAYTAVVGASTGALKAFRIALATTGIGAIIVGIGYLISKFSQVKTEIDETAKKQKLLNSVLAEGKSEYTKAVVEVNNLKIAIQEAKDGVIKKEQAVKLYNDTIGKTAGSVKTLDEAEKELGKNANAYIQFTLLKAAANIALNRSAEKAFEAIVKQRQTIGKDFGDDPQGLKRARAGAGASTEATALKKESDDLMDIYKTFQVDIQKIAKEFKFDILGLGDPTTKNKIENVYLQKLKELQARLAGVTAKSFESEGTIRKQFAASLEKELFSIDELLKKKQLTSPQATILKGIIEKISAAELDQALGVFREKQAAALRKIQDSIDDAMLEDGKRAIENIRDEFDRERQAIEQESLETLAVLSKKQAEIAKQIDDDTKKGLISPAVAKRKKFILTLVFGDLASEVEAAKATRQVELSYKVFQNLLEDISSRGSEKDVQAQERLAELVREERDKLDAGLITFKQFQDNLTKLTQEAADLRRAIRRKELQEQLDAVNASLEASDDPAIIKRLTQKQLELRGQLATIDTENATGTDPTKKRGESVQEYVTAIAQLTDSIIAFWQKANEAESAALDKSIALQEKRVDAAQRIAARGNAQYLKQEEDRLKELQVQKENAARRELAINAALQASQLLVGITGAISKIATPGIGIAETIGAIATIFAALATGYGLVKSLQGSQPKLAKGTLRVRRNGHPAGTDTIPAWLNEDEAVIPADKNKAYHPTVKAVYEGNIPADQINNFVKNYHRIKSVPQPNYDRIKNATDLRIGHDGKLAGLLEENNNLQRQTLKAMKHMSVSASIDRNGVAIAVNEYVQQMEIDKKL